MHVLTRLTAPVCLKVQSSHRKYPAMLRMRAEMHNSQRDLRFRAIDS